MPYAKYIFKPGIDREGTDYSNEGGWYDANLVRFRKGRPEKIGGWQKATTNYYLGTGRALHGWVDLAGTHYLGLGTTYKYYVELGSAFHDITPIRTTTSPNNAFAAVANTISAGISATDTTIPLTSSSNFPSSGVIQIDSETITYSAVSGNNLIGATRGAESTTAATHSSSAAVLCATITVTDSSHGAVQNDFVTYSSTTTLGGNITATVLDQEYQIVNVVNTNSYTIKAKDTSDDTVFANSSDSNNGRTSTSAEYQINVGLDVYVEGTGWGMGTWGSGGWGSVGTLDATNQLRLWSHDNFGEDLIMNVRAGGIYYWDESGGTGARAVALTALSGANLAPTKGLQVLVSEKDRHVICLGADPLNAGGTARTGAIDPMFIAWSDQENAADWEPKATNTAGSLRISSGSDIIGGLSAREEILIWTDISMYSMTYIGPPFTFGINLINQGVGLIGPKATVNTPSGVYWMDRKGFYKYDGNIELVPCSVHYYVFSDFNQGQSFKTFGFLNKQFNEVGWFYPSADSTEIDRYVVYNYGEGSWTIGQLARYAWLDEGLSIYPRATGEASSTQYLYNHENGNDADGSPMDNVYIQSSDFDMHPDGNDYTFIRKIIPDVKFTGNGGSDQTINFVLKSRDFPGDSLTTDTTQNVTSTTQKLDTRVRARQLTFRVESDDDNSSVSRLGVGWRLGDTRMDVKPDGRR